MPPQHQHKPVLVSTAAILIFLPLIIFLIARLSITSDGAQIVLGFTQIRIEGLAVEPLEQSPAGLHAGDIVLAVEGRSVDDWLRAVFLNSPGNNQLEPEETLDYTVLRDGQIKTVTVRLEPFPLLRALLNDWSVYLFPVFLAFVGLLIFVRRPHFNPAQVYFLTCTAWLSTIVISFLNLSVSDLLHGWMVVFTLGASTVLGAYALSGLLHFSLIFPRRPPLLARFPGLLIGVYLGVWLIYAGFMVIRWNSAPTLTALFQLHWQGVFVVAVVYFPLILASYLIRYRMSSDPTERRQMRWILWGETVGLAPWAGFLLIASFLGLPFRPYFEFLGPFLLAIPATTAIAIVRERLFDIDLIIHRTLVYTVLTAALVIVYFGSVVILQSLLRTLVGQGDQLAIVASTLAIAALFTPLRRRVQGWVDRRFYRRKYNAEQILASFSARLKEQVDLNQIRDELVAVVHETMQPEDVSLLLWTSDMKKPAS